MGQKLVFFSQIFWLKMDQNENSIIQFFDLFIKKWTLSSKITNVGDSNSNTPYILAYCLFAD